MSLSIDHMQGVFLIVGAGLVLSVLAFFLEVTMLKKDEESLALNRLKVSPVLE